MPRNSTHDSHVMHPGEIKLAHIPYACVHIRVLKCALNFADTGELPTECIPGERFADLKAALNNVTVHGTILKLSEGQHGPYRASPHTLQEGYSVLSLRISIWHDLALTAQTYYACACVYGTMCSVCANSAECP
jgi:hypothetical protein